jgi:hypothetical protein
MKKYVVTDQAGKYQVVAAEGFTPPNVVCPAPSDAQPDDGPYITVTNGVATYTAARVNKPKPV